MAPNQKYRRNSIEDHVLFPEMLCPKTGKLYIFGYGSLIWKPNISYSRSWIGYIKGYKRRFYQGTTTHRGTPDCPGRVVTLLPSENKEDRVWGKVYEVDGAEAINEAIDHLAEREMIMGGYRFDAVSFYPLKCCEQDTEPPHDAIRAFVYIAEPGNDQYIGSAPLEDQAHQIASATGVCGPNSEYLQKLVNFINTEVPEDDHHYDQYSLDLWSLVDEYLQEISLLSSEHEANNSNEIMLIVAAKSISTK
ncbi:hypothetical protein Aperf_G00000037032 [Anoplocephala perfoliata]